eukprot:TRINITY_DN15974_c0_g1_i1.p1 TRINITY_DN15974_c0_g1~~TRINITY_DN15974_c0_g1_i1.p1  ORF type:complete len:275 (-),score=38.47 TRINITY_DN15974_c0_g1_i1:421-1245(-)
MGAQACSFADVRVPQVELELEQQESLPGFVSLVEGGIAKDSRIDRVEDQICKDCDGAVYWSRASTHVTDEEWLSSEATDNSEDQICRDYEGPLHWSHASTHAPDEEWLSSCASESAEVGFDAWQLSATCVPENSGYDTACAVVTFQHDGLNGMGLLTVKFKPVSIAPCSFAEALKTLALVSHKYIRTDFAVVFDMSELILPSPFVLPRLLNTVKAHLVHLDTWRKYQRSFSVVVGESPFCNAIVNAVASACESKNKPFFATDRTEAYLLLSRFT